MINKAFNKIFKNPLEASKKINVNLNLRPNELSENEYFKITEFYENQI